MTGTARKEMTRQVSGQVSKRRPPRASQALTAVLQQSIVLAAALATLLFAVPLAVSVQGLYRNQAFSELARDAESTRASITALPSRGVQPAGLQQKATTQLGVYDAGARLMYGVGPLIGEDVVANVGQYAVEEDGVVNGNLIVVVPIPRDNGDLMVVRASRPYQSVRNKTYATWALMGALAAVVLVLVTGLARARARQIARPLEELAVAANQLGQGDFSIRAVRSGVLEVDAVSTNLEATARRLGDMLERERRFSSDASHQLRTPLTAVRIGLEAALLTPGGDLRSAAVDALNGLDRLEQTVEDLLLLARDVSGQSAIPVPVVVTEAAGQWGELLTRENRWLDLRIDHNVPQAAVSAPALRTVLDVLLGNALVHGGGTVTVRVEDAGDAVVVEVGDEGSGVAADPSVIFRRRSPQARGTGIGLALARSLIEADGGRLELTRARPATFTVLLPVAHETAQPLQASATG
ncbi:MAG TPA: HAMP domain-containing sensor histidine kinase [Kineosporiaceae bacterium]